MSLHVTGCDCLKPIVDLEMTGDDCLKPIVDLETLDSRLKKNID